MSSQAFLLPQSTVAIDTNIFATGDASVPTTIAHLNLADDDDGSLVGYGPGDSGSVTFALTDMPKAQAISKVTAMWRGSCDPDANGSVIITRPYLVLNGTRHYATAANETPTITAHTFEWLLNPAIIDSWTAVVLNAAQGGMYFENTGYGDFARAPFAHQLKFRVDYEKMPAEINAARDAATRRIWIHRRRGRVILKGPAKLLDFRPGTRIELAHIAGPHAIENGWLTEDEARRPLWVERTRWNPDKTMTVICVDHHTKLCLMFDSGYATAAGPQMDGLMAMSPGALTTHTRASNAEVLDATGQLVSVQTDVVAHSARGQVAQASRTNSILNSAFALGVDTSWTSSGEGSNGSSIAADTSTGLWRVDLSPQSCKIQGGSPAHAADLQHAAAAVTGRTGYQSVSIWHIDHGGPLSVAVQRAVDSKWYRASDQTWQASKTWNALAQLSEWGMNGLRAMDAGVSSTSLTVYVGIPTATAVAGQYSNVAQVQIEAGKFPTSPILTTNAAVTRAADVSTTENNTGKRTLSASQFTFMREVEPFWSVAELTAGDKKTVALAYHDASNYLLVEYVQATAVWRATLRVAGVNYIAEASHSPVANTRYVITVRFCGSRGELGRDPYTLSILVDGVEGATTAVASGPMTEASPASIQHGHNASSAQFDGALRQLFSSPQVLTDTEISRGI